MVAVATSVDLARSSSEILVFSSKAIPSIELPVKFGYLQRIMRCLFAMKQTKMANWDWTQQDHCFFWHYSIQIFTIESLATEHDYHFTELTLPTAKSIVCRSVFEPKSRFWSNSVSHSLLCGRQLEKSQERVYGLKIEIHVDCSSRQSLGFHSLVFRLGAQHWNQYSLIRRL